MQTNEYLFPDRLTRRDFIKLGALATAGLAATGLRLLRWIDERHRWLAAALV